MILIVFFFFFLRYPFPKRHAIVQEQENKSQKLTPKDYVSSQGVVLGQTDDLVDFEHHFVFPTLFFRRIRHAGPSVRAAIGYLSFLPENGTRVCGVWTHSENRENDITSTEARNGWIPPPRRTALSLAEKLLKIQRMARIRNRNEKERQMEARGGAPEIFHCAWSPKIYQVKVPSINLLEIVWILESWNVYAL